MTQSELLSYYEEVELRCKGWSLQEVKDYIKEEFGNSQRVYLKTCWHIRRNAELNQR